MLCFRARRVLTFQQLLPRLFGSRSRGATLSRFIFTQNAFALPAFSVR